MTRTLLIRRLAAAVVILVVAACSSPAGATLAPQVTQAVRPSGPVATMASSPVAGGGGSGGPCAVFTTDKIASIVGQPVHVGDLSTMGGTGCQWVTADGKAGVVIQRYPSQLGYADIAQDTGQTAVTGIGDKATIGPTAFYGPSPDGPFDATIAAAIVGQGFDSVLVAPPPTSKDVVLGLLKDLIAAPH